MAIKDPNDKKSSIHMLYLDLVNAFGSIDHKKMSRTVPRLGYPNIMMDTIEICTPVVPSLCTILMLTNSIPSTGQGIAKETTSAKYSLPALKKRLHGGLPMQTTYTR